MKKLVCGCFGTIYYATILKNGLMSDANRVDVTDDALQAVINHIIMMQEYKKNDGFSGYTYNKKDGGKISLVVIDNDKYKITKKVDENSPQPTDEEIGSDAKFLTHLIQEICAYAYKNGLEQNDTLKTVGNNLAKLTDFADFSHNTGEENVGDE